MVVFKGYRLQLFTAIILKRQKLLQPDKYKDFLTDSLQFLVKEERVTVQAFVIMDHHIQLIWQMLWPHTREAVQRDLLKFTAQRIKFDLLENHPQVLPFFKVRAKDREYQFWERKSLSVDMGTKAILEQRLRYMHESSVRAGCVSTPASYRYSSARFYETGVDDWGFLSSGWHHNGGCW
ncbi:transposase [Taibaiella koreensis]|uniref:transposase n=1 Tax=Taibaiella koreensis TaxID=1268548 RepID=UPI000E5A0755|nr:transposase [Taibaiella koreensis]